MIASDRTGFPIRSLVGHLLTLVWFVMAGWWWLVWLSVGVWAGVAVSLLYIVPRPRDTRMSQRRVPR